MALLVCGANGNFSAAATWQVADATFSTASTSSTATALTTSYTTSSGTVPGAIVCDALAVKVLSRAAGTPTNNLILSLYNTTDAAEVTSASIPVSDIPAASVGTETHGGWFLWKFSGNQTLIAGKTYALRARLDSTSTAVSLGAIATTNYQRLLRTTTTASPSSGDPLFVLGEWTTTATFTARTATIDYTTTTVDLGSGPASGFAYLPGICIGKSGTVNATTGSTVYCKISGNLTVFSGGTLSLGTTGTPFVGEVSIVFDTAANSFYGLRGRNGGTISLVGSPRTAGKLVVKAKLTANATTTATTLNVDTDTGWLSGDEILVTNSNVNGGGENEVRILNGNASTASMNLTSGMTYLHGGTTASVVCRALLLTRNVKLTNAATAQRGDCEIPDMTISLDWCQFDGLCITFNAPMTTASTFTYVSVKQGATSTAPGLDLSPSDNIVLENFVGAQTVAANVAILDAPAATSNYRLKNIYLAHQSATAGIGLNIDELPTLTVTDSLTAIEVYGASVGIYFTLNTGSGDVTLVSGTNFDDFVLHGCDYGIRWQGAISLMNATMNSWDVRRCTVTGLLMNAGVTTGWYNVTCVGWTCYGNGSNHIDLNMHFWKVTFDNCVFDAQAGFPVAYGLSLTGPLSWSLIDLTFESCSFSAVTGHTNGDLYLAVGTSQAQKYEIKARNTIFAATTAGWIAGASPGDLEHEDSYISSIRDGQVSGQHRVYRTRSRSLIEADAAVFNTAAPSEKITPATAATKARTGFKQFAVAAGVTYAVSVYVRKDAAYNGNQPRLIARRNDSIAVTADTTLDTMSGGTGAWEQLTGNITPTYDGVLECYVDLDGTAGYANVDDWSIA